MDKIRESREPTFDPATLKLVAAFVGSLAIYILAFTLPANLFKFYNRVGLDGYLLNSAGVWGYARLILAFAGLAILYIFAIRAASQTKSRSAWIIVIGGMLTFILVLLFMAPFDALDIYNYVFYGRITAIYGGNPFQQVIAEFTKDPFFYYTVARAYPSAYGPLWEMLAGLTARLAGNGIITNVIAFKLLTGIFYLASVAVIGLFIYRTTPDKALPGILILGWNPVALYEIWGNGHNDMAMVFWVILAVSLINRKRYSLATLSLVAGALFKYIPILLVPIALLIGFYSLERFRTRLWFLFKTSLVGLSMIVVAYIPFWNGLATFSIYRRMQMYTTSIPTVINLLLNKILVVWTSDRIVSFGALGLLSLFILYQLIRLRNQKPTWNFTQIAFNILAFYLMVTCLWFQQWYSVWLIGLAPLLSGRWRRLALLFGFWVLGKQLLFGPLIIHFISPHPKLNFLVEPLLAITVLGGPWIYTLLNIHHTWKTNTTNLT